MLYTHLVITRFLYQSAGLNEHQNLPKAKVAALGGFSFEMGVNNSVIITCPETLTHQLKRCLFETVSVLHAVETCTRN